MVDGIKEIMKAFESMSNVDRAAINKCLRPSAERILRDMVQELPEDKGTLALSFRINENKKRLGYTVGPRYGKGGGNHWNLVELGYKHRSGRVVPGHFIERKVYDQNRKNTLDEMEKNLAALIEKTFNES